MFIVLTLVDFKSVDVGAFSPVMKTNCTSMKMNIELSTYTDLSHADVAAQDAERQKKEQTLQPQIQEPAIPSRNRSCDCEGRWESISFTTALRRISNSRNNNKNVFQ
jgi:hypothetical protein